MQANILFIATAFSLPKLRRALVDNTRLPHHLHLRHEHRHRIPPLSSRLGVLPYNYSLTGKYASNMLRSFCGALVLRLAGG